MGRPRRLASIVVALCLAISAAAAPARAQVVVVDPLTGAWIDPLFYCPGELAVFSSLKHGSFDYCRQHLRYAPGSLDCLQIIIPTCNLSFLLRQPGLAIQSEEDRVRGGHGERIVCPEGPPPPMCPASFPAGPIPRR